MMEEATSCTVYVGHAQGSPIDVRARTQEVETNTFVREYGLIGEIQDPSKIIQTEDGSPSLVS